MGKTFGRT